jgi:hypothetical protein
MEHLWNVEQGTHMDADEIGSGSDALEFSELRIS